MAGSTMTTAEALTYQQLRNLGLRPGDGFNPYRLLDCDAGAMNAARTMGRRMILAAGTFDGEREGSNVWRYPTADGRCLLRDQPYVMTEETVAAYERWYRKTLWRVRDARSASGGVV